LPAGYNFHMPKASPKLSVKVLFFGRIRELTGLTEEQSEVPADAKLDDLFAQYVERYPKLADFRGSLVASRNQEFASWDAQLAAGDEVAFLPPVSGG
jgi:molybdopterin converting factor subunit 1